MKWRWMAERVPGAPVPIQGVGFAMEAWIDRMPSQPAKTYSIGDDPAGRIPLEHAGSCTARRILRIRLDQLCEIEHH